MPFLSPGDIPDPGIKPGFPALQADSLSSEPLGKLLVGYVLCDCKMKLVDGVVQIAYVLLSFHPIVL